MPSLAVTSEEVSARTELAAGFTVKDYRDAVAKGDRRELGNFLINRFEQRYFKPMDASDGSKHGFMLLSMSCLAIETLEAFYQGKQSTKGKSARMFMDFFHRCPSFKVFAEDGDWFYNHIRCGLLHQGETRGGWRIRRKGPLLDKNERIINASLFVKNLRKAVVEQADEMGRNDDCWKRFLHKMEAICKNCCQA